MTDPQRNNDDVPVWRELVPVVVYIAILFFVMLVLL